MLQEDYHKEKSQMITLIDGQGNKTPEMKQLEDIYLKGNYGAFNLLSGKACVPLGLSSKGVWELVHGKKKKSIRKDYMDYLIGEFVKKEELADHEVQLIDAEGNPTKYLEEIRHHHNRTAVGTISLLRNKSELPRGLTPSQIEGWIAGKTKIAQLENVNYVLELWRSLPDADIRIPITDQMKIKLLGLIRDANVKTKTFIKETKGRAPNNLVSAEINSWISGTAKSASAIHWDFFINELENILKQRKNFIAISDATRQKLLFEKKRTGISPKALLREQTDLPDGMIKSWVAGWLSGVIDMAEESHLNYVLKKWQELPQVKPYYRQSTKPASHERMPRMKRSALTEEITEEVRGLLQSKFNQGTITAKSFLRRFSPVPDGLTENTLSRWVNGSAKKARKEHLTFVLEHLGKVPVLSQEDTQKFESIKKFSSHINREIINEKDVLEIKLHQARTGVGATKLLKNAKNIPEGLASSMITAWTNHHVRTAYPEHIKYVLELWRKTPDTEK